MNELEDFELEPSEAPEEEEKSRPLWPWAVAVGLVAVALGIYFGFFYGRAPEEPPVVAEEAASAPTLPVPAGADEESLVPEDLPRLDESDVLMRQLATRISAHPQLVRWLVTEDLARRFAVAVDNIAAGKSPRTHLPFLEPDLQFSAVERGGRYYVDSASYRRFGAIAEVAESLDPQAAAEIYRGIKPLMQEAYKDLGYPERDFDATLERAFRRVLDTPVIEGEIELEPGVESYQFADSSLEGRSEIEKQLLRLGPENLRRLQMKVRRIAAALEMD